MPCTVRTRCVWGVKRAGLLVLLLLRGGDLNRGCKRAGDDLLRGLSGDLGSGGILSYATSGFDEADPVRLFQTGRIVASPGMSVGGFLRLSVGFDTTRLMSDGLVNTLLEAAKWVGPTRLFKTGRIVASPGMSVGFLSVGFNTKRLMSDGLVNTLLEAAKWVGPTPFFHGLPFGSTGGGSGATASPVSSCSK